MGPWTPPGRLAPHFGPSEPSAFRARPSEFSSKERLQRLFRQLPCQAPQRPSPSPRFRKGPLHPRGPWAGAGLLLPRAAPSARPCWSSCASRVLPRGDRTKQQMCLHDERSPTRCPGHRGTAWTAGGFLLNHPAAGRAAGPSPATCRSLGIQGQVTGAWRPWPVLVLGNARPAPDPAALTCPHICHCGLWDRGIQYCRTPDVLRRSLRLLRGWRWQAPDQPTPCTLKVKGGARWHARQLGFPSRCVEILSFNLIYCIFNSRMIS